MLRANARASLSNTCRNTLAIRGTVIMLSLLLRTDRNVRFFLYLLTGGFPCHPSPLPPFSFSSLLLHLTPIGRGKPSPYYTRAWGRAGQAQPLHGSGGVIRCLVGRSLPLHPHSRTGLFGLLALRSVPLYCCHCFCSILYRRISIHE